MECERMNRLAIHYQSQIFSKLNHWLFEGITCTENCLRKIRLSHSAGRISERASSCDLANLCLMRRKLIPPTSSGQNDLFQLDKRKASLPLPARERLLNT
jgi:hypothetical protein